MSKYLLITLLLHGMALLVGSKLGVQNLTSQVASVGSGGLGAIQVQMGSSGFRAATPKTVAAAPKKTTKVSKFGLMKKPVLTESAAAETSVIATNAQAGSVGGSAPGGMAGGTTLGGNGVADTKSVYKAELRSKIDQNKFYPLMSKRLGHTGVVVVAFTLLEDGSIVDVRVDKPSSFEPLNDSALEAVKKVGRFKPIPKEFDQAKMDMRVPVNFLTI